MHKYQRNSIGVVRLEEIEADRGRVILRIESAEQSGKHQIARWRVVAERRRKIGGERATFSFDIGCQLLCRTAQRERRIFGVEIERGRDRRGDSSPRRELVGWIDESHADKRAANTLVNTFFSDEFFFDLLFWHKRGEVVWRPDCVTGGFKPQMIGAGVPCQSERMVPEPLSFTGAQQNSEFTAGCVVGIHGWRFLRSASQQWSGYGSRLQIIGSSCFSWNVRGARLAHDACGRRVFGALCCLRRRRATGKKR